MSNCVHARNASQIAHAQHSNAAAASRMCNLNAQRRATKHVQAIRRLCAPFYSAIHANIKTFSPG